VGEMEPIGPTRRCDVLSDWPQYFVSRRSLNPSKDRIRCASLQDF
jgi:hypothetical protein